MYVNSNSLNVWKKAKGSKKEYGRLLRKQEKEATALQKNERLSNLRKMLVKGTITQEEYNLKTKKAIY